MKLSREILNLSDAPEVRRIAISKDRLKLWGKEVSRLEALREAVNNAKEILEASPNSGNNIYIIRARRELRNALNAHSTGQK